MILWDFGSFGSLWHQSPAQPCSPDSLRRRILNAVPMSLPHATPQGEDLWEFIGAAADPVAAVSTRWTPALQAVMDRLGISPDMDGMDRPPMVSSLAPSSELGVMGSLVIPVKLTQDFGFAMTSRASWTLWLQETLGTLWICSSAVCVAAAPRGTRRSTGSPGSSLASSIRRCLWAQLQAAPRHRLP